MKPLLLLLIFVSTQYCSSAQFSDMISVRKKNGTIIKTFMAGSPILFEASDGNYVGGNIQYIRNDSIFVMTYDIRTYLTSLGVTRTDTFSRNMVGYPFADIVRIKINKRPHFILGKVDKLLMFGGAGYFALNLINGAYLSESVTSKNNLKTLGISAGAFGLGALLQKFFGYSAFTRKRHKIVYLHVLPGKNANLRKPQL